MKYGNLNLGQIEAIINKLGGIEGVYLFLNEEIVLVSSNIVKVNKSSSLDYSHKTITYPIDFSLYSEENEAIGPSGFDAGRLVQWYMENQDRRSINGTDIHQYLVSHDMIKDCLGFRDLRAIQQKSLTFFRRNFFGKLLFAWKTVIRGNDGKLYVPYLYEIPGGILDLRWMTVDYDFFNGNFVALIFNK